MLHVTIEDMTSHNVQAVDSFDTKSLLVMYRESDDSGSTMLVKNTGTGKDFVALLASLDVALEEMYNNDSALKMAVLGYKVLNTLKKENEKHKNKGE